MPVISSVKVLISGRPGTLVGKSGEGLRGGAEGKGQAETPPGFLHVVVADRRRENIDPGGLNERGFGVLTRA